MMLTNKEYVIALRRELHEYPELDFDLSHTVEIVKRELDAMKISYTEKYGKGSVVATLGNGEKTVALRADMDALPITEKNGVSYCSKIPGRMHACGHDAHTAMLLAAAKALKVKENELPCCVKLLFQPSEEGLVSGAMMLIKAGALDDVDYIIAQHVDPDLPTGTVGVCPGAAMASSHNYRLEFFGRTAHATLPHTGADALAAAVTAYQGIQVMLAREMNPFARYVCSIGALHGGTTQNVVAEYACMLGTVRTYDMELDGYLNRRIKEICAASVGSCGVRFSCTDSVKATVVQNAEGLCQKWFDSAAKVVGNENTREVAPQMCSEDFSRYGEKVPALMFRLGVRNENKGAFSSLHNPDFNVDEDALQIGSSILAQMVLDA